MEKFIAGENGSYEVWPEEFGTPTLEIHEQDLRGSDDFRKV